MRQETRDNLAATIEGIRRLKAEKPEVSWWIGVLTRMGGYGDFLVGCALARAARRHWRHKLVGREVVGVMAIGCETRMPEDADLSCSQGDLDAVLLAPAAHFRPRAIALRDEFDLFLEDRLVVRSTFYIDAGVPSDEGIGDPVSPAGFIAEQLAANARLDDYREFYDHYPQSIHRLQHLGLSQFDLMARTAGLDLSPGDLACDTTLHEVEGFSATGIAPDAYSGCVTIHNGQGEGVGTKRLPDATAAAIAGALAAAGHQVVQLGIRHPQAEPPIQGAVDLRGLRLPETAAILANARLHVDIEGFRVHLARAVATPSVVFFGPTPPSLYGYPSNVNVTRAICPAPYGPHCIWHTPGWSLRCLHGCEDDDGLPLCLNHPQEETAARIVRDVLAARPPEIRTGAPQ